MTDFDTTDLRYSLCELMSALTDNTKNAIAKVAKMSEQLAELEAQNEVAYWESTNEFEIVEGARQVLKCSECRNRVIYNYKYCPNCGRKMRRQKND